MTAGRLDVAIIGAGPYGLSIAAHLRAARVEHRLFGTPMEAWADHMPAGMNLKTDASSSDLSDPERRLTFRRFCAEHAIAADAAPVPLATFLAYGRAFASQCAPEAELKRLVRLDRGLGGFEIEFDDGESLTARRVVIATGILPFCHVPAELRHLPAALLSHSSSYGPLDRLDGKEVAIIGAGASALDLAALLTERGTAVTVIARRPQVTILGAPGPPRTILQRLRAPSSRLGPGWFFRLSEESPRLARLLPAAQRRAMLRATSAPSGGHDLEGRVVGRVPLHLGRSVERVSEHGGRVLVETHARDGTREGFACDHLLAATGYRIDVARLDFLSERIKAGLRAADGSPTLSADFQSSIDGLYFVGPNAAYAFGPAMRFVYGAMHPARRLARDLPKALFRRSIRAAVVRALAARPH
ncbi:MAG TPA: FAD-dependent oxidoreductase [Stellaceae bacterium]|nr:FAD-dependent oxidoreductase [Stellaceae bacterium]